MSEQCSILRIHPDIELHRGLFAQSISQLSQGLLQQGQAGPECGLGGIIETRFNCTQLTITYKSLSHTASKYSLQAAGLTVAHSSMMLGIKQWSLCQDYCLPFCLRLQQQKGGYNAQWTSHLPSLNLHSLIKWLCFVHHLITISGSYSLFCARGILAEWGKIATLSSSLTTSVHAVGGAAMHVAKQSYSETVGLFPKRRDDDCGRRRWSVTHLEFSQTLWSWIEKMKGEPEDIFF